MSGFLRVPLVSVIISNYNYEPFLREAIDSALNQTYSNTEVIVEDDGSTDDSQEIIESYENQIIPISKENGGQASVYNIGFELSRGEITIFLDSDDVLLPNTVERVVEAFRARPSTVKVQYRQQIVKFPHYVWPGGSGNAYAASVLRQILPVPQAIFYNTADQYLCDLSVV